MEREELKAALNEALNSHTTPAVLRAIAEVLESRVGEGFKRVHEMRKFAAASVRKLSDQAAKILAPGLDPERAYHW